MVRDGLYQEWYLKQLAQMDYQVQGRSKTYSSMDKRWREKHNPSVFPWDETFIIRRVESGIAKIDGGYTLPVECLAVLLRKGIQGSIAA